MQLEKYIDHTLLKPTASPSDIVDLCTEAKTHQFYAVCVNSCYVPLANMELAGSGVKLATVVGFPLGAMATAAKVSEAAYGIEHGADEIDMVINLGWLKAGRFEQVKNDIKSTKEIIGHRILKVIIETCYLTDKEKRKACALALEANADFVKTSTGFGTHGATLEDVQLMKEVVGDAMKIKASGGIKDKTTAVRYIEMGVSRIGTSLGVTIIKQ